MNPKIITLTQGKVTLIDEADYDWLNQWKWFANKITKGCKTTYYVRNNKVGYMHSLIMGIKRPDHIDGDGLNNQRNNLRIATRNQNSFNMALYNKKKSSKYKGVCWMKYNKKWRVYISPYGKRIHLGCSFSEDECAKMYNEAAIKYFGEFARLNIIQLCL